MEADQAISAVTANAGFLLSRVGTAVQTGFKELLSQWGVRPLQFAILSALSGAGSTSQQELCTLLGVDSGNMVELVDKLEALGFAERRRDPRDRRRYLLAVTAAGQAAFEAMRAATARYTSSFLAPLSQAEQEDLVAALAKLYATTSEGQRWPRPEPARRP